VVDVRSTSRRLLGPDRQGHFDYLHQKLYEQEHGWQYPRLLRSSCENTVPSALTRFRPVFTRSTIIDYSNTAHTPDV
jgi:hypothetical protein